MGITFKIWYNKKSKKEILNKEGECYVKRKVS